MLSFAERLQTFAEWPKNFATKPQALAEAGFTYAGPYGEKHTVRCAECNCIISYEDDDDGDPWQLHASRYPPCSWIVAEKGDESVANCQRMSRRKDWRRSFSIPELQELCEAAGLDLDYDVLFKDCMTYQNRVDKMIWRLQTVQWEYFDKMALTTDNTLIVYSNIDSDIGIRGKPTMTKCRKVKTDLEKWGKMVERLLVHDEQLTKGAEELARRKRVVMRDERKQGGRERKQGEQERKQGEQERKQGGQESEQGGQESEQGGQESEQGGQESEQGGQESEPIRKEGKQGGRERKQGEQERKQGEQERKQGEQERKQGEQESEQGGQERKQGEQERKQGGQESEQGGQESEQGGQESEQGGQVSEQGGQESEQGGQESEQGGQESEPIRKEGKQGGRGRKQGEQERKQGEQERKQGEQERKQGEQESEQGGQERKQGEQERKQGGQESEQGGQESEQGGQESEQGGQESEQGGQVSEQGGQETEQGGQESEQGGQESEPIRKEGKQRGRKRQANRTNTFQAKKSCPDVETPKPSDCGHCGAKTDQPNPVQNIFVLDADGYREAVRDSLVTIINNTVLKRGTDQIPTVPDKKAKLSCDKCDKSYTRRDNLKKHIAAQHEYPKTCENCSESFDNQSSLSKHQNACGQSTSAKSKTVFNCPQCSKSYFNESFLQNHIKTQHERNDKICLTCGEIFTGVSSCKKHKETCGNNATSVTDGDEGLAQGNANLRGKGEGASAKPPQNSQGTSSSSSRSPCKLCFEEPVDIAKHYLDHHNIRDPSSMLVTDRTFLIPTGGNQHCDSVWFSIQFAKAVERYTDTVCRLCDRDLRHQLKSLGLDDLEVHYIGDHKVNRKFLSATKRLIRKDGV